ncbi:MULTISPECIES: hypothetical protein [unclassified Mesorhizobium]|uniref:hypothetical protein n=1 Tax=unclassified Mesorhizobium TaxID=325217 RepID=UPI000FD83028|nr:MULTISPECIES: hypothetical protein [unclassified Mesorhizobium]TGT64054.1 hypothetical protein EN809_034935 [Mesorhizobium sp. M2E.F.Ca.ET.166.01.1.1]TGV97062.1 hypothetical protein EN797_035225 [Mesorhizobium sp. M2E.F.Ca.ET.154.01.1.1]
MRGLFYFALVLAIGIWAPPITGWAIRQGLPISVAFFIALLTLGALAWHIARWMTTGRNW